MFKDYTWKREQATDDIWKLLPAATDAIAATVCFAGPDTTVLPNDVVTPFGTHFAIASGDQALAPFAATFAPVSLPNATSTISADTPLTNALALFPVPGDANNALASVVWDTAFFGAPNDYAQATMTNMLLALAGNSNAGGCNLTFVNANTPVLVGHPTTIQALAELGRKGWSLNFPDFYGY
jgi:hypothetical protein